MSYSIGYLPSAIHDLADIAGYIGVKLRNPAAADRLADEIVAAVEGLSDMPYRYAVYVPAKPLRREYRRIVVEKYLVFYWVDEERREVTVARVLYGGRRVEDALE